MKKPIKEHYNPLNYYRKTDSQQVHLHVIPFDIIPIRAVSDSFHELVHQSPRLVHASSRNLHGVFDLMLAP